MESKRFLITGGTDGIGRATAMALAQAGAELLIVGRVPGRGEGVARELGAAYLQADLTRLSEVRRLAEVVRSRFLQLDGLIHSAGFIPTQRVLTTEGNESLFAVQYLARFALNHLLLPELEAAGGKVISVAGGGSMKGNLEWNNLQGQQRWTAFSQLRQTSIANDLITLEFQQRYPKVRFYNFSPGFVVTNALNALPIPLRLVATLMGRLVGSKPDAVGTTLARLALENLGGGLYNKRLENVPPRAYLRDRHEGQRLWDTSSQLASLLEVYLDPTNPPPGLH